MIVSIDDIMIGDLVLVDGKPTKIDRKHYVQLFIKIEAIPLTSEILEKLGFTKTWNGDWQLKTNATVIISKDFHAGVFESKVCLKYIHELQHLLAAKGVNLDFSLESLKI